MKERMTSKEHREMISNNTVLLVSDLSNKQKISSDEYKLSDINEEIDLKENKHTNKILAIDPGNEQSAWAIIDINNLQPIDFKKDENEKLLYLIRSLVDESDYLCCVMEMIASYGMAVGKDVFETCVWIGRFKQELLNSYLKCHYVYRKDVKIALCGTVRANDSNIRQSLIDRFGVVGTKKEPGYFYGFSKDIWSAYAVGITWIDKYKFVQKRS